MNDIEFWEKAFFIAARNLSFNRDRAFDPASMCKEFANDALKHRRAKVKELKELAEWQESCRTRLQILRELGPVNDLEAEEYADLVAMEENGEFL